MPTIAECRGPPVPSGSTPIYTSALVDTSDNPIPGSNLNTLTLTIADTLTGMIINGVQNVNILNANRGIIDQFGNVTVLLEPGDTMLSYPSYPRVERSLIFVWTYNGGASVGIHQANFKIDAVAIPIGQVAINLTDTATVSDPPTATVS